MRYGYGQRMVSGLVRTAHLGPCLVITALTVIVGVAAGVDPATLVLVGVVVLFGQLSIGWSNDVIDATHDRLAGRTDKPIAQGSVSARTVWTAAIASLVAALGLSLIAGWWFAAMHAVTVAAGWAYNLWLKRTWLSGILFLISFGLLPSLATLAASPPSFAPLGETIAAASLGLSVHLANTLPDLESDTRAGVKGLPHLLGRKSSAVLSFATLIAGALALTIEIGTPIALVGLVIVAAIGVWGFVLAVGKPTRTVFWLVIAASLVLALELVVVAALE
jgi:4-hydroxybenzoate polyprenyltransferase